MADESSLTLAITPPVGANQYNPIANIDFPIGTPVCAVNDADAPGNVTKARVNATATASVTGVAAGVGNAARNVHVQFAGPLTLTTAQWDAITGGSGGLTPGSQYFLSSGTAGRLTTTAPSSGGTYATQVGIATSPRTLLIQPGVQKSNG